MTDYSPVFYNETLGKLVKNNDGTPVEIEVSAGTAVELFQTSVNTGELVATIPVDAAIGTTWTAIYRLNIGPCQVGDIIDVGVDMEVSNDETFLVSFVPILLMGHSATDNYGTADTYEIAEGNGENIDHTAPHHKVVVKIGAVEITQTHIDEFGTDDVYITFTGTCASSFAGMSDTLTIDQDYGRMFVKKFRQSGSIPSVTLPSPSGQTGKVVTSDGTNYVLQTPASGLPSQTGNNAKFLTTNGTSASWATTPVEIPSQTGNSGKVLKTDGTNTSWQSESGGLPSQSGNTGKYLTTDGSSPSWDTPSGTLPSQTGNSGKYLTTNGTAASWSTVPSGNSCISFTVSGNIANATRYLGINAAINSTESNVTFPMPFAGTMSSLYIVTDGGPGGAQTFTYTVRKNSTDTALTCTQTGSATTANDTTHNFSFSAGDLISLKIVGSATASGGNLVRATVKIS